MSTPPTPAPANTATEQLIETITHDILIIGLAAAAFFIKNPNTAQRAGQVVNILQGITLGGQPLL